MRSRTFPFAAAAALLAALPGCSRSTAGASTGFDPSAALPTAWYLAPENGGPAVQPSSLPNASERAGAAVESAVAANLAALEQAPGTASPSADILVPWHLDGLVSYFGVSEEGIFGTLLFGGTESIKATWQLASSSSPPRETRSLPALRITSSTLDRDLPKLLEPSVQFVTRTGSVKNEAALRRNLLAKAQRFLGVARLLDGIPPGAGWRAEGLRLTLALSGGGEVTSVLHVGGAASVSFEWVRTGEGASAAVTSARAPRDEAQQKQLALLLHTIGRVIPEAEAESRGAMPAGFLLDQVQVGVGATTGGDIGIASAKAELIGRVIFRRSAGLSEEPAEAGEFVNLLEPSGNEAHRRFAEAEGLMVHAAKGGGEPAPMVYRIPVERLHKGILQALKMSSFFVSRADKPRTGDYRLKQLEAEFDTSLTGGLTLSLVTGVGQIVFDFDRVGK